MNKLRRLFRNPNLLPDHPDYNRFYFPWKLVRRHAWEDVCEIAARNTRHVAQLQHEVDVLQRGFQEARHVNHHNAAAHRASEVAALRSNVAQNDEIARLRRLTGGSAAQPPEPVTMPAMKLPQAIPVPDPAALPENK
jgi:phytoene/squalene synthetase